MKKYTTQVTAYNFPGENESILGIEVPAEIITDFKLVPNEILNWEIDVEAGVAKIIKTNIIANKDNKKDQ